MNVTDAAYQSVMYRHSSLLHPPSQIATRARPQFLYTRYNRATAASGAKAGGELYL